MARVVKGGSWEDTRNVMHPMNRLYENPITTSPKIGFRCAWSVHDMLQMTKELLTSHETLFSQELLLGLILAVVSIPIRAAACKSQLTNALQEYSHLIKSLHALGWYDSKVKRKWVRTGNSTKASRFTL